MENKKQIIIAAVVMGLILALVAVWQVAGPELVKLASGKSDATIERPKRRPLHELITEADAQPRDVSIDIEDAPRGETASVTATSVPTSQPPTQMKSAEPKSDPAPAVASITPAPATTTPPEGEPKPQPALAEANTPTVSAAAKPESNPVGAMISQLVSAPAPEKEASDDKLATASFSSYAELDALFAPVAWLDKASDGERVRYTQELRTLLAKGIDDGPGALDTARKRFDAAKKICADDPRLGYAFAVALWKHGQQKEAIDQMQQTSRQMSKPRYYPALLALAWMHLSRDDQGRGLPVLRELATELAGPAGNWPGEHVLTLVATRFGRIVGFYRVSELPAHLTSDYEKLDAEIESRLNAELREAYAQGRKSVAADVDLVKLHASRPADDLKKDAAEALELYLAEQAELTEAIQLLQQEIDEIDTNLQLAGSNQSTADRKARLSMSQYQKSVANVRELSKPRTYRESILTPITRTDSSGRTTTRYETRTVSRAETPAERAERLSALSAEQANVQQLQQQLVGALKSAKDTKDEAVDTKLEGRPLLLAKQGEADVLKRKRANTEARIKLLRETPPTPEALTERLKQLATFVPFDPYREKQNVQATLSMASKSNKPATKAAPATDAKQ